MGASGRKRTGGSRATDRQKRTLSRCRRLRLETTHCRHSGICYACVTRDAPQHTLREKTLKSHIAICSLFLAVVLSPLAAQAQTVPGTPADERAIRQLVAAHAN